MMKDNRRLNYILELLKEYPETKYILTNQFLAGELVHSYINDENNISSFSVQPILELSPKLYGVYEQKIDEIVIIFDFLFVYPRHREYNFYDQNFKLIFKTNVENFDNLYINQTRSEKLKDILGN